MSSLILTHLEVSCSYIYIYIFFFQIIQKRTSVDVIFSMRHITIFSLALPSSWEDEGMILTSWPLPGFNSK